MRCAIILLIVLLLSACVTEKSVTNSIISIPLMIDSDIVPQRMAQQLKKSNTKRVVPVDESDPRYSYPLEGGFYEAPANSSDKQYDMYMKTLDVELIP